MAVLALAGTAAAQGPGDLTDPVDEPAVYCDGDGGPMGARTDAEHTRISAPLRLARRVRTRTLTVGGVRTRLIEGGRRRAKRAVVFVHGNPGSSKDWVGLLTPVSRFARAIAVDFPGFGDASDGQDFEYTPESMGRWLDRLLARLGVRRAHLVLHDFGGPFGLEWAAAHPERLASAVLIDTGVLLDYYGHALAHTWRTPGVGESSMASTDRSGFHTVIQNGQTKPLPRDFVDRMYDDFDRMTRCAVLRLYRNTDDPSGMGYRQAAALRPRDIPALVIWGEDDPYLPPSLAYRQREAFPRARVVVFEDAAHWPFIDYPRRTAAEVVPFLRAQLAR